MTAGDLITTPFQVEWRAQVFGGYPNSASSFAMTDLTGWLDLPGARSSPTDRPGRQGAYPSQLRASGRVVEVELTVMQPDASALLALCDATAMGEDDPEEPLVVYPNAVNGPQLVFGRCEKRAIPTDADWSNGYERARLSFACSDPRRYSVALHTASTGLLSAGVGGLVFPVEFPLAFGTASGGGVVSVFNAGSVPTWPVLTVTGPVTGPIITRRDTGDTLLFDSAFVVPAGYTLIINTDMRTVTMAGVNQRAFLNVANWFSLPAGTAVPIGFTSPGVYDPSAVLSIAWRDADQ
jgi:hypothetical protein